MKRRLLILCIIFFLAGMSWASADVPVVPSQLAKAIAMIEERQTQTGSIAHSAVKVEDKDGRIVFSIPPNTKDSVTFEGQSSTIVKHFSLRGDRDGYAFEVDLQHSGQAYQHVIRQVNDTDALIFFNDTEIFVYTQSMGADGVLALKEWIYALKPNAASGSRWEWIFKSEKWQWPLTVEMSADGSATINRHLPFAGIPITGKARSQYMLDMMVRFKRDEPIKKYFPYSEAVVSVSTLRCSNREGIKRPVSVGVVNSSVIDESKPKVKVGLDFDRWDEHWRTVYTTSVKAKADEYPLLIE